MRPLASIYSHRVPGFMETQIGFNPNQKRNSNPKKETPAAPVGRPAGRPTHATVDRPGQSRLLESEATSVGRPGPIDRAFLCTPVHADRPGRSTGLLHRSTGRSTGSTIWPAQCIVSRFLCRPISVLPPSISSISSLPQSVY